MCIFIMYEAAFIMPRKSIRRVMDFLSLLPAADILVHFSYFLMLIKRHHADTLANGLLQEAGLSIRRTHVSIEEDFQKERQIQEQRNEGKNPRILLHII